MTIRRTPASVRRTRVGAALAALAGAVVLVLPAAAWAGYTIAPRGFDASSFADLGGSACGGAGPTGLGVAQSRMWAAADGRLLVRTSGSSRAEPTGSIAPWGIAPFRSGMYATQPGCDVVGRTGMPPDPGLLGTPCNVVQADGDGNEIAVVADVCGTAITLQPGTNWPTVATRDGRIVVIDPEEGAVVATLVDGLGSDPALHLAWRGSTLYYARASGGVWTAGGGRVADVADVRGLLAPTGSGLSDLLLVTTAGGAVVAVDPSGARPPDTFGRADDLGGALAVGDEIGILVGHAGTVWQLDGSYEPPAPPPPPPTETSSPPRPETSPAAAPPPPAQAPPPAPPPPAAAAPAAPSTSVTQVVTAPGSASVATSAVPGTATAQAPAIGLVPDDVEGEPQLALEGNRRRDPAAPLLFVPAAGILLAGAALQLERDHARTAVAHAAEAQLRERFGRANRSRRSSRAW